MPLTPVEAIAAWEEALLLMVVGDKWEIFSPSDMAWGEEGLDSQGIAGVPRNI